LTFKAGQMDALRVKVEALPTAADEASRTAAQTALTKRIKEVIGVTTVVEVGTPGSVERSQGKARRVVDLRG